MTKNVVEGHQVPLTRAEKKAKAELRRQDRLREAQRAYIGNLYFRGLRGPQLDFMAQFVSHVDVEGGVCGDCLLKGPFTRNILAIIRNMEAAKLITGVMVGKERATFRLTSLIGLGARS